MLTKKYVIICLTIYFIGLYIFFTTQFITHQQIQGYSTTNLLLIDDLDDREFNKKLNEIKGQQQERNRSNKGSNDKIKDNIIQDDPVSQVVLIIIDALRYDYLQRMEFFKSTIQKHPKTTLTKKSLVGNPTMTTQRIQSLMTGSEIFTSTNILDMFLSSKIKTDNIIDQLFKNNKTLKVFGDDTWVKLFNIEQKDAYVCDSTFNIRDYDSCDELIYENLSRFVKKQHDKMKVNENKNGENLKDRNKNKNTDKQQSHHYDNLLIAHFLALDHIGHSTSSITSYLMQQKMQKISLYLQHLIQIAGDRTMFIITGDHGMREDGNHGGNTHAEVQSLFFAYYKNKNIGQQFEQSFSQRVKNFQSSSINQVDITPTLAVLLNIPNPINSIGYPIMEILPKGYQPYLNSITYNILTSYQHILQHYHKQASQQQHYHKQASQQQHQQTNQNEHKNQCLNKITTIKKSLLLKQTQSSQFLQYKSTFLQHIKLKQYIKQQIQQSSCLSKKLSMVQPNEQLVMLGLFIMAIGFLLLIVKMVLAQLKHVMKGITNNNNNTFVFFTIIRLLLQQHMSWLLSLFTIYFSWYLIRNSSTYLFLIMVIYIFVTPNNTISVRRKFVVIVLLFVLTQFQTQKVNQYEVNLFNINVVQRVVHAFSINNQQTGNHNNNKLQMDSIKSIFHILAIAVWTMINLKHCVKQLKSTNRKRKSPAKRVKQTLQYTRYQILLSILLLVINFICVVLQAQQLNSNNNNESITTTTHSNTSTAISQQIITSINPNNIKFYLRYSILFFVFIKLYLSKRKKQSMKTTVSQKHQNNISPKQQIGFVMLIVFGQLVGKENFLCLLIYVYSIKIVMNADDTHVGSFKSKSSPKKTTLYSSSSQSKLSHSFTQQQQPYYHPLTSGTRIILISLMSQYMWWILGNRYQYSSIDIKKSYLLSDQFNIYTNGLVMMLWFNLPYIVAVIMVKGQVSGCEKRRGEVDTQFSQKRKKRDVKLIKQQYFDQPVINQQGIDNVVIETPEQQELQQEQSPFNTINPSNIIHNPTLSNNTQPYYQQSSSQSFYLINITKLLLIPLSGLFSSALNLYLNNMKILFTVVYVPLMILGMVKTVVITLLMVGLILINKK